HIPYTTLFRSAIETKRDVVLIIRAVGDVKIDIEIGLPLIERANHGLNLRRIDLRVIAIQIEVLRTRAPARLLRPALVHSSVFRAALVTVDIEDGNEKKIRALEQVAFRAAHRHVA